MKNRVLVAGVALAVLAAVTLVSIKTAVADVYRVPTNVVSPEVPSGARVLVNKLADARPGAIVAYRNGDQAWLARVVSVDPVNGTVQLSSNSGQCSVAVDAVIGEVVLTTR